MDDNDPVPQALDEFGQQQADAAAPLRPHVIHEVVREEGEAELRRAALSLALSGFAAGLSMGFSFLTLSLLRAGLPDAPWHRL
ncbi:MAG: formate/nitrite transporter family protein, partial [Acetobacteraceae bacterium]|nr:formate/nitrite transporter family protein [Acetobacteraceae bacterium]